MRGLVAIYFFFLVLFSVATPFLAIILYRGTNLSKSVLPVLIGFCIQGFFLVILFGLHQRQNRLLAMRNHKITLRTRLEAFILRSLMTKHSSLKLLGFSVSAASLADAVQQIELWKPDAAWHQRINVWAEEEVPIIQSLAYIAAQIDYEHLETWNILVADVRGIRDAADLPSMSSAWISLMQHVCKFDQLIIV